MARVETFNPYRWIILHVAFIVQSKVNAQSLTPSPNEFEAGQNMSKTTVFVVLFAIFFVFGLLSVSIRHCIRSNPEYSPSYFHRRANDGCSRRGGLDDAVVESFPVFAYSSVKESKIGSGNLECAICLNEMEDRETVRLLPICNHLFHIDCIDAWLYSHATCPVCRSNLTAKIEKTVVKNEGPPLAENTAMRDHVTIDIETVEATNSHHLWPSSEIVGKFPRSNSTGHSIGRFSDGTERYTLRLPDDVKRRIMAARGRKLKRTRSFDADLTAECRGKFCRSGEESGCHDEVGPGVKLDWVNWADRWVCSLQQTRVPLDHGKLTANRLNDDVICSRQHRFGVDY